MAQKSRDLNPVLSEEFINSLLEDGEKLYPAGVEYLHPLDSEWAGGWDWPTRRKS